MESTTVTSPERLSSKCSWIGGPVEVAASGSLSFATAGRVEADTHSTAIRVRRLGDEAQQVNVRVFSQVHRKQRRW